MDLSSLFKFAHEEEEKEKKYQPKLKTPHKHIITEEEEEPEFVSETEFKHEYELHEGKELSNIKYGKNEENKVYIIEPDSILNPKNHLSNLTEEILLKNGTKKNITYNSILHFVYTKLLCRKPEQEKILSLKNYNTIRDYFEENLNKCRIYYENITKEEFTEIGTNVSIKRIPIRIIENKKELTIYINIEVINFIIDKYEQALRYILKLANINKDFHDTLMSTDGYKIIYRDPELLQYTKTNNGFVFEFNKRLESRNIYGKILEELREKIKYNFKLIKLNAEKQDEFKKFIKNEMIKKYIDDRINIVVNNLKIFFEYLVSIAFPITEIEESPYIKPIYKKIMKDTQHELELRQSKKDGFFLTPDMANYVIKEIILFPPSSEYLEFQDKNYIQYIIKEKLDKHFNVLKKESIQDKYKSSKYIIATIIWNFAYQSFLQIKGDNIQSTINNIKNEELKLLDQKCENEDKTGKLNCIINAITYILITIMDWNEFVNISKKEIDTTLLILNGNFFKKNKEKILIGKEEKYNETILKLLKSQLNKYELTIEDKLLIYLTNIIDFIMTFYDENPYNIWNSIMFYNHKF